MFASVLTGVSLLHTFNEYSLKQQQEELKNEYIDFHNDLGTKLLYAYKIDAASNEFSQVLKIDPTNIKATTCLLECNLSNQIGDINNDPEAMSLQLNSLSAKYPNDPMPFLLWGEIALSRAFQTSIPEQKTMYFNIALNYYNNSLKINKNVTAAYIGKGFIFDQKGYIDGALEMEKEAVNISSWSEIARNNVGYAYYEKKDYQNAINWYMSSIEADPFFLLPYYFVSNSYRMIGDLNNTEYYQLILIAEIEDTNITNRRANQGVWSFYTGSNNRALLSTMTQKKYYAYYDTALTYYLMGDKDQAKKYVNLANDLDMNKVLQEAPIEMLNFDIKNLHEKHFSFKNDPEDFIAEFEPTSNTTANG